MPMARCCTPCRTPRLSSRMPATLPPLSSTSLGHFSVSPAVRPVAMTKASCSASAATKDRRATMSGVSVGRISRVAARLPSGLIHARPRRPRAAVCRLARIQVGPASEMASRAASALVLSTSSSTRRS